MSALASIPGVDYCGECGMDWHQPRRQGWHYPECSQFHQPTNAPAVEPVEPRAEADDDLPC